MVEASRPPMGESDAILEERPMARSVKRLTLALLILALLGFLALLGWSPYREYAGHAYRLV